MVTGRTGCRSSGGGTQTDGSDHDAKLWAEGPGTALLLIGVVGSGIRGEALAGGNIAIALLDNAIATGCLLYMIITVLGPLSGAHFNPAITSTFWLRGGIGTRPAPSYVAVQITGGILGVWATHAMFNLPILQASETLHRTGPAQWWSEGAPPLACSL